MKQLVSVLFALVCCTSPCHAQFGALSRIYSAAKTAKQMKKAKEKASEDQGNKKVKDVIAEKTESEEYKKAMEELNDKKLPGYEDEKNPPIFVTLFGT